MRVVVSTPCVAALVGLAVLAGGAPPATGGNSRAVEAPVVPSVGVVVGEEFALTPGTHQPLAFAVERFDNAGMHDPAQPEDLVPPIDGLYLVSCGASIDVTVKATAVFDFVIRSLAGGTFSAGPWDRRGATPGGSILQHTGILDLTAGQTVRVTLKHDDSGPVTVFGAGCRMVWLAPRPS